MWDFDKGREEFNEDWVQTVRRMRIWAAVNAVLVLSLIGFGVWVVIKVMSYFGVI